MPSVIVKDEDQGSDAEKVRKGMVALGKTFDEFYEDDSLSPLTVLMFTFQKLVGKNAAGNFKAYFQAPLADGTPDIDRELKFKGLNKNATGITFRVRNAGDTKRVVLKPVVDDYDADAQQKTYRMRVAFPNVRKSEIDANGYLSDSVRDIVVEAGLNPADVVDINAPTQYLFGSISYRRCI